jgi:hypothetical protein
MALFSCLNISSKSLRSSEKREHRRVVSALREKRKSATTADYRIGLRQTYYFVHLNDLECATDAWQTSTFKEDESISKQRLAKPFVNRGENGS